MGHRDNLGNRQNSRIDKTGNMNQLRDAFAGVSKASICSKANAKSFDSTALYVIVSEARRSPTMPSVEIASSLRSSQ